MLFLRPCQSDPASPRSLWKTVLPAPYDRTNPSCVSSGGDTECRATNHTLTGTCTDDLSGCINETIQKTFTTSMDVNNASPGDVSDKAGNITTCPGNQTVRSVYILKNG